MSTPFDNVFDLVRSLQDNNLDVEAAKHLSEALKQNSTLTSLEYAQLA